MRLQVSHSKRIGKTEKQKKIDKEKKRKGPKLSSSYTDNSEYTNSNIDLDLTKMRYGVISSCYVTSVTLHDGAIKLENSWIELLLIMLDTVISNNTNFRQLLMENEVTNASFCIETTYGKYPLGGEVYRVYNIFNSGYYLESTFTSKVIFDAIVGLTKCLGMQLDEIKFHVVNKLEANLVNNFAQLEEYEALITIDDAEELLNKGVHLKYVDILGEVISAHRLDVVLLAFCNVVHDKQGLVKLAYLPNTEHTGTFRRSNEDNEGDKGDLGINRVDIEEMHPVQIRNSEVYVYTNGNEEEIISFLRNSIQYLGLSNNDLRFKVTSLIVKDKKHHYEIEEC